MATPKIITAGVTPLSEANLNKFIAGNGTKVQIKVLYANVIYSGGNLVVDSGSDSCGIATGDLSYDTGGDFLKITVSGFTNIPHVQLTRHSASANYIPAYLVNTNTQLRVEFYDPTDLSVKKTPGAVDTHMNFNIFVIGF